MAQSPIMETFIANLKLAMVSAGMTQKDLSEKTGILQPNISRIIAGDDAWLSTIYKLADGVGYEAWELLKPDFRPTKTKTKRRQTTSA